MVALKEFDNYPDTEVIQKILKGEQRLYELLIRRNNPFLYLSHNSALFS